MKKSLMILWISLMVFSIGCKSLELAHKGKNLNQDRN